MKNVLENELVVCFENRLEICCKLCKHNSFMAKFFSDMITSGVFGKKSLNEKFFTRLTADIILNIFKTAILIFKQWMESITN